MSHALWEGTNLSAHPHPLVLPIPRRAVIPGSPTRRWPRGCGTSEAEAARSVALLTARHWHAMHDYATVCLASGGRTAAMVTGAALHRVLDRVALGESAVALRPVLLVGVRDTVREWAADDRVAEVLPGLLKPAGGRGMRAATTMTPENRTLAQRAYRSLPALARCLLWHVEVEAEPISVPAGLLGTDVDLASGALDQARDKFRQGLVRAHQELAPTQECRFYNRLLDVPIRRGGELLPDVRRHMAECRYCRNAAEQLGHFESGLGTLLAEAVLGWGARRYLDSRPGRAGSGPRSGRAGRRRRRGGGDGRAGARHRLLSRIPVPDRLAMALPDPVRSTRTLLTGLGAVSAGVLVSVLIAGSSTPDGGTADPTGATGAGGRAAVPSASARRGRAALGAGPHPAAQHRLRPLPGHPRGAPGRLRRPAGGVLHGVDPAVDVRGGRAAAQRGRPGVVPGLPQGRRRGRARGLRRLRRPDRERRALRPHGPGRAGAALGRAAGTHPGDPDANADIVVKVRDRTVEQRWAAEPVRSADASSESLSVTGPTAPDARYAGLS